MAKNSRGKRPCSICRKWFTPDVKQKGRQTTCGPVCQKERHRRQCEKYNKKHKANSRNDYLTDKIEKATTMVDSKSLMAITFPRQRTPVLPLDVIISEYGIKPAIIIQYLVSQIINHTLQKKRGFP